MLTEKELGERLKNIRKMRNISQFRMADMMGTEQSTIAKFEKGASYPKVSTLLEVDVVWCGSGYAYYLQMRSLWTGNRRKI